MSVPLGNDALGIVVAAISVTSSGCTLIGATGNGGPYTGTVAVDWLAVQMIAGASSDYPPISS